MITPIDEGGSAPIYGGLKALNIIQNPSFELTRVLAGLTTAHLWTGSSTISGTTWDTDAAVYRPGGSARSLRLNVPAGAKTAFTYARVEQRLRIQPGLQAAQLALSHHFVCYFRPSIDLGNDYRVRISMGPILKDGTVGVERVLFFGPATAAGDWGLIDQHITPGEGWPADELELIAFLFFRIDFVIWATVTPAAPFTVHLDDFRVAPEYSFETPPSWPTEIVRDTETKFARLGSTDRTLVWRSLGSGTAKATGRLQFKLISAAMRNALEGLWAYRVHSGFTLWPSVPNWPATIDIAWTGRFAPSESAANVPGYNGVIEWTEL